MNAGRTEFWFVFRNNWIVAVTSGLVLLLGVSLLSPRAHASGFLVSSRFSNNVLLYDADTGAFQEVFASGGGLINAIGMDFGPTGDLFVASGDQAKVFRYDGHTGDFLEVFVVDDPATPRTRRSTSRARVG